MTLTELYDQYLRHGGYELTAGDFFSEPTLDARRRTALAHSFSELRLAARAAGSDGEVPAAFLAELASDWLAGEPTAWPCLDDERAARYCDPAEEARLMREA